MKKVYLRVAKGVHSGRMILIREKRFVVGQDPSCQIRANNPTVGRHHCEILIEDDEIWLRDLGAESGTIVNEEVIHNEKRELQAGDVMRVGPLAFTLWIESATKATSIAPSLATPASSSAPETEPAPSGKETSAAVALTKIAPAEPASQPAGTAETYSLASYADANPPPNRPSSKPLNSLEGAARAAEELLRKLKRK